MNSLLQGSWAYVTPTWETRLNEIPDYLIKEETGLNKDKLKEIIEFLYDKRVL